MDLAARDSATVGGTIATNAGGIHTIRYGPTRAQLLGLEAVLADGSVISRLSGIQADNTGYDLTQLIAGSEGTLAVITAARFRLWPAEPPTLTVLAGPSMITWSGCSTAGRPLRCQSWPFPSGALPAVTPHRTCWIFSTSRIRRARTM